MINGIKVSLDEILFSRDRRVEIQNKFILLYKKPVISFTMNIAGNVKNNNDIKRVFEIGVSKIDYFLKKNDFKILDKFLICENTGNEYIISVDCDDALKLKEMMIEIEEQNPTARLFDIDVIDINSKKLSRENKRKCLICNNIAQECARAQLHSIEEVHFKILELLNLI